MSDSLSDWITSLAAVAIMCGAGIYAGVVHLRDRLRERAALADRIIREELAVIDAERVLSAEGERVRDLYPEPESSSSN